MNLKTTTVLAIIMSMALPWGVKAQTADTQEYKAYRVSCRAKSACQTFDVTYQPAEDAIAQTRRTRRTRSSTVQAFKNWYLGAGAGIFFGENLDVGFQGNVFGGTKFNEYIGTDLEFTFGFAGIEDVDENITLLGLYLNPRFEYKFEGSNVTGFVSPGFGFSRASAFDDSDTEFDFQIKLGASFEIDDQLNAFAQGRFQNEAEAFGIEGGVIFDL